MAEDFSLQLQGPSPYRENSRRYISRTPHYGTFSFFFDYISNYINISFLYTRCNANRAMQSYLEATVIAILIIKS